MPYPAQIDYEAILTSAEQLLERTGIEQLSLTLLASELGVKTPSLYRYIVNRDALLRSLNERTMQQLFSAFNHARGIADPLPIAQITAVLRAQRAFAHTRPHAYMLAFSSTAAQRPDPAHLVQLVLPLQECIAQLVGANRSLSALRGGLALVHGFVMLELNNQLQRGGDLNAAFEDSVRAYLAGLALERDH
jgi:AcrR family transcriptional regulator